MIFCTFFVCVFITYFHQMLNQNYFFICFHFCTKRQQIITLTLCLLKENFSISYKLPFQSFVLCMLYSLCVY